MQPLKYLTAYPESVLSQVRNLIESEGLRDHLLNKYPRGHEIRTDRALYDYVMALKSEYLRRSEPLNKIVYDNKLKIIKHALGTHTTISRVQGRKLKKKREIRIAALFKDVPLELLRMIAVHELAHIKQSAHDKAFYQLCCHMEPGYHQLEFDLRLFLTWKELPIANEEPEPEPLWTS